MLHHLSHPPGLWWDCSTQGTPHIGGSGGSGSSSVHTCHTYSRQTHGDKNTYRCHGTALRLSPWGHNYML